MFRQSDFEACPSEQDIRAESEELAPIINWQILCLRQLFHNSMRINI